MIPENHPIESPSKPAEARPTSPPPIRLILARAEEQLDPPSLPDGGFMIHFSPRTVTLDVIRDSFEGLEKLFPPILTLQQAAELVGYEEQTLRKHLSEGKYQRSSRRGHPVRFLRDIFVLEFMQGGLK